MGEAVLDAEEGDEIEVLVGSFVREAVIEKLIKDAQPPLGDVSKSFQSTQDPEDVETQYAELSNVESYPAPSCEDASNRIPRRKVSPDRFYDSDYQFVVRDIACEIIDQLGPITFRHISEKIARLHGFQRTGRQIRQTVWAATHRNRKHTKGPKGENIFWPKNQTPGNLHSFRGMKVQGEVRSWSQVPYPEKLGLAVTVLKERPRRDPVNEMSEKIGLGRLRRKTREELEELIVTAREISQSN